MSRPTLARVKPALDCLLIVLLPLQMSYLLFGEERHEWLGMGLGLLFLLHNLLNWRWYRGLFRGKYNAARVLQTAVNLLTLLAMLGSMVSGILLSRFVFDDLPIHGAASFARKLHMLSAYWGFILLSLHLGLHWEMFIGMAKKALKRRVLSKPWVCGLRLVAALIAVYGAVVFVQSDIPSYLFLINQFVFFDVEQPFFVFYGHQLAMMGLWVWVAHYGKKLAGRAGRKPRLPA